jgi:hypothetical protein
VAPSTAVVEEAVELVALDEHALVNRNIINIVRNITVDLFFIISP